MFNIFRRPIPKLDEVPSLVGHPLSFDDIVTAYFPGFVNVAEPDKNDVLIVAESCGMGVSIRSEKRVRVTGSPFLKNLYNGNKGGGDYMFVPTDGGDYPLQDIRRHTAKRHWIIIR